MFEVFELTLKHIAFDAEAADAFLTIINKVLYPLNPVIVKVAAPVKVVVDNNENDGVEAPGAAQVGTPPATVKTFPVDPIAKRAGVDPLDE
jgi:hypothetical protein